MTDSVFTIYVADDHPIVIDGLHALIDSYPQYQIVGEATDGNAAYNEILQLKPDIAILDINMPHKTGIEIINQLVQVVETKFIILSMFGDTHHIQSAVNAGAKGYLLKNMGKDELIICLQKVLNGNTHFTEMIAEKIKEKTILSDREINVINFIAQGFTSTQIAEKYGLSVYTVETHRKNIYRKTGATSIAQLIQFAKENGIIISHG